MACRRNIPVICLLITLLSAVACFGQKIQADPCRQKNGSGTGIGIAVDLPYESTDSVEESLKNKHPKTTDVSIISKPKALYTDLARKNCVQGTVKIQITFYANGRLGKLKVIKGLLDGLTTQSVSAAKKIRFEPARKNGIPYTVTRKVEYNFTLY